MSWTRWARVLVAPLLLASCAPRWQRTELLPRLDPAEYPGQSSVLLLDETVANFHPDPGSGRAAIEVTRHTQRLVLEPQSPSSERVRYVRGFMTVSGMRARVIRPGGLVEELDPSKLVDAPVLRDEVLYSDDRQLSLPVPALAAGSILEVESTMRYLAPRLFPLSAWFGGAEPVRVARLTVSSPAAWELEWLTRELDRTVNFEPAVEARGDELVRRWELRDVKAAPVHEPFAPPARETVRSVQVRLVRWSENGEEAHGFRRAAELSAWAFQLAEKSAAPAAELRLVAARLAKEAGDEPEARARRIHAFVAEEIRYCAIEDGFGAWRPHPAGEVLSLRYGDCKDKSNLLRAMLAAAGIGSRLAMASTHRGWAPPAGLMTPTGYFNHMVLLADLPRGPVLLDPTASTVPFGEVPVSLAGSMLLPVTAAGSELQPVPEGTALDNVEDLEVSVSAGAGLGAKGRFTLTLRGEPAAALRAALRGSGKKLSLLVEQLLPLASVHVEGARLRDSSSRPGPVQIEGELELPVLFSRAGGALLLRVADAAPGALPALKAARRELPVVFKMRRTGKFRLNIELPAGAESGPLPAATATDSRFVRHRLGYRLAERTLVIEREVAIKEHVVATGSYGELKDFLDRVLDAEARPVLIRLKAAGGSP